MKTVFVTIQVASLPDLYKDGEENHHNGGCDEETFLWKVVNQEDQGETDCSSQAAVGNDELVSEGHRVPPELVHHSSEQENALRTVCIGDVVNGQGARLKEEDS